VNKGDDMATAQVKNIARFVESIESDAKSTTTESLQTKLLEFLDSQLSKGIDNSAVSGYDVYLAGRNAAIRQIREHIREKGLGNL